MPSVYNAAIGCASKVLSAMRGMPSSVVGKGKTRLFLDGQASALRKAREFTPGECNIWFHCASLGEYAIARPIMSEIRRRRPDVRIALTFFSSTGVRALARKRPADTMADYFGYLPLDTPANAAALLDIFRPSAALFMVSEYWPNYLAQLKQRGIPTYLVSCVFTRSTPHFKPFVGAEFRRSLEAYTKIFCLDSDSVATLSSLGVHCAVVEGDPLVDNAMRIRESRWSNDALEKFCSRGRTLICGSIHNGDDLNLIAPYIRSNPDYQYLLVPHEVDEESLRTVEHAVGVPSRRLSAYTPGMIEHVLIVDHVGSLAYLYRLGTMAYIGGGFTRQLHSIVEASVYGLPVAFGPRIERKRIARLMLKRKIATVVSTPGEFAQWARRLFNTDNCIINDLRIEARQFCKAQAGATGRIVSEVLNAIDERSNSHED